MSWLSSIIEGDKSPSDVWNEQVRDPVSDAWDDVFSDDVQEWWNEKIKDPVGDAWDDIRRSDLGRFWNTHFGKHGLMSRESGLPRLWDTWIGKHGIAGWVDDKWIEPIEDFFNPDMPTPQEISAARKKRFMDHALRWHGGDYGYKGRKKNQMVNQGPPEARKAGFDEVDIFDYLMPEE